MPFNTIEKTFVYVSEDSDFTIYNLPYGVFHDIKNQQARIGVAIGDFVLDLALLEQEGLITVNSKEAIFNKRTLNTLMSLGKKSCQLIRHQLIALLNDDNPLLKNNQALREKALIPSNQVTMHMPVDITGYTDFYSSEEHATNIGKLFRPDSDPLLPNWKHVPVAYNGRASSIVISGTPIRRPKGQIKVHPDQPPIYAASQKLDFELEVGFFIGQGNPLGHPIPIRDADQHIFGYVLVNDWSARDIQQWEYQPLGPFLGKIFATSISPWVVPVEALEPFKIAMPEQHPTPVEYLQQTTRYIYDITLEVQLKTSQSTTPVTLCRGNYKHLYWSTHQQLAHHTITGCNMRTGDLLASGSISGPTKNMLGSLIEQSSNGKTPIPLPNDEYRCFLEDGDEVTMLGWCQSQHHPRVGFGQLSGLILPAHP